MVSKTDLKIIFTSVLVILGGVYLFIVATRPALIFRGYPSSEDWNLPTLSLHELSKYDGVKNDRVFISVMNVVFDVTDSGYYNQESAYGVFAGTDCTVMLAVWKAEKEYANLYNTWYYDNKIKEEDKEGIKDMYEGTYVRKYTKVARIWETEWEKNKINSVVDVKYEDL